ncbi:hypothetical protein BH160DRAFT_7456 [Burkholderia sp. H160]|nr:hypothetical protein BH160DRAFT_7456 [Burkholderia sp. H160]
MTLTCASLDPAMPPWMHAPNQGVRRIAIVMFNDCSLQGAGVIAEAFENANELATSGSGAWLYDVSFLSAGGGMVTDPANCRRACGARCGVSARRDGLVHRNAYWNVNNNASGRRSKDHELTWFSHRKSCDFR